MSYHRQWLAEQHELAHAINSEPWDPPPGMVKRLCCACGFWFATADPNAPACVDCWSGNNGGKRYALARGEPPPLSTREAYRLAQEKAPEGGG